MINLARALFVVVILITSIYKISETQALQNVRTEVRASMRHKFSPYKFALRSMSSENNGYILKTGEAAKKTLELQHRILAKNSIEHLEKAGLKENQVVWDVGCGSGAMTEHIARQVGSNGRVYAFDISEDQITVTRKRLEAACLKNVTFIRADICEIDYPVEPADIIYSRLVLMHVKNPKEVIEKMISFLKPGGSIALQESIMSTARTNPSSNAMKEYVHILTSLGKRKGVDFDIGLKLADLCSAAGFKQIQSYFLQPTLTPEESESLILGRSAEWEKEAINLGITTEAGMQSLKLNLKSLFVNADSSFSVSLSTQSYIIATKG